MIRNTNLRSNAKSSTRVSLPPKPKVVSRSAKTPSRKRTPSRKKVPKEPEILKATGFDDCVIGVVSRCGSQACLAYSVKKIIKKLMKQDGMSHEEAMEHFSFNIEGSYVGPGTPYFLEKKPKEIELDDWIQGMGL